MVYRIGRTEKKVCQWIWKKNLEHPVAFQKIYFFQFHCKSSLHFLLSHKCRRFASTNIYAYVEGGGRGSRLIPTPKFRIIRLLGGGYNLLLKLSWEGVGVKPLLSSFLYSLKGLLKLFIYLQRIY